MVPRGNTATAQATLLSKLSQPAFYAVAPDKSCPAYDLGPPAQLTPPILPARLFLPCAGSGCDRVVEVDECALGSHNCHAQATCRDTAAGFECTCRPGYTGDGRACLDVDECATGDTPGPCHENAVCTNIPASFSCTCKPGFAGNGVDTCRFEGCLAGECQNGGSCVGGVCQCAAGVTGDRCQDDVCAENDCGKGAGPPQSLCIPLRQGQMPPVSGEQHRCGEVLSCSVRDMPPKPA